MEQLLAAFHWLIAAMFWLKYVCFKTHANITIFVFISGEKIEYQGKCYNSD